MSPVKDIPLYLIFIDEIARPLNQDLVETYAAMYKKHGMSQPILVEAVGEKYRLVFGRHRYEATKFNGDPTIKAVEKIYNKDTAAQERTIDRVLENLGRNELNALERAEHLAALKGAIEGLEPFAKHGGDRKSQEVKNQSPIFGLVSEIADKTPFSRSSFFLSVAICKGISGELRERIHGTFLASHQSGLKLLADQKPKVQETVLNCLFTEPIMAKSVAEALTIVNGERLVPANERRITSTQSNLVAMNRQERISVLASFEDEIREIAQMNGWF